MIDSHCHLDFKEFNRDREEAIKRFFANGGEKIINVGCNLESSIRSLELAKNYGNIFASVGVHPHDAETVDDTVLRELEDLVEHYKVIAVGEIGLDFFSPSAGGFTPKEKQADVFKAQLELAENHKKPVIIHCREAYVDLLNILKDYKSSDWRGVAHCFLGSWPIAQELLDLGFYLGFTGAITYAKKSKTVNAPAAPKLRLGEPEIFKVVKNTPLDRILIETDCPFLAPAPKRGKRNDPLFVKYVIEKIAEIKGISVDDVEKATSKNAEKLFGI